jgi:hypothetical protein
MSDENAYAPLPQYISHKKVWALKIARTEADGEGVRLTFVDPNFAPLYLPPAPGAGKHFRPTGDGDDPGYYVRYGDGYESWSPTKAFIEGYTPIADGQQHEGT